MEMATFRSTFTRVAEMRDTLAAWQSAGRLTLVLDHGALTDMLAGVIDEPHELRERHSGGADTMFSRSLWTMSSREILEKQSLR